MCAEIRVRRRRRVSTGTTNPENKWRAAAEEGALITAATKKKLPARRHPCTIFRAFMTERDESSIATCSACRSSVREMTGKSRTKAQARATIPKDLPWPRSVGVPLNFAGRQKRKAPAATSNQMAFSSTSMSRMISTMQIDQGQASTSRLLPAGTDLSYHLFRCGCFSSSWLRRGPVPDESLSALAGPNRSTPSGSVNWVGTRSVGGGNKKRALAHGYSMSTAAGRGKQIEGYEEPPSRWPHSSSRPLRWGF